ncbi:6553_t:CDS:2, partial [Acaulospora morrowiae]
MISRHLSRIFRTATSPNFIVPTRKYASQTKVPLSNLEPDKFINYEKLESNLAIAWSTLDIFGKD